MRNGSKLEELILHQKKQPDPASTEKRALPAFQPPLPPILGNVRVLPKVERLTAMRAHLDAMARFYDDLAAWERAFPVNVALVFDSSDSDVHAITRNIGGGWRTTSFSKLDHQPNGHAVFSSRLAALQEERGRVRLTRIPFAVEPAAESAFALAA